MLQDQRHIGVEAVDALEVSALVEPALARRASAAASTEAAMRSSGGDHAWPNRVMGGWMGNLAISPYGVLTRDRRKLQPYRV